MANITIAGADSSVVTLKFNSAQQAAIAQQLANAINAGLASGTLVPELAVGIGAPALSGVNGELVVEKGGLEVLSPGYEAVVANASDVVLLGDGQGQQSVLSGNGGLTYLTMGGSGTVVAAGGDNRVVSSGDGWYVSTGSGDDTLQAIDGAATLAAGGGHNVIELGSGPALVDSSGHDQVQGGSGAATITVETRGHVQYTGGSGTLLFIDTGHGSSVVGGSGSETIFGSIGRYSGGSDGNNLLFGEGTLTGGGGGDQLWATGARDTLLRAGGGNETLSAALSSGADTLVAGPGNDTLFSGFGHDVFQFNHATGGGDILVRDFSAFDSVQLVGYGPDEAHNALANAQVGAAGTTLHLSDNTTITFAGVSDATRLHLS